MAAWRLDGKPRTSRRFTVYRTCPLATPEDRLFFLLTYLKTYAVQVVQGRLFGMSQSKANQWIHVLLPALLVALRGLGDAPRPLPHGFSAPPGCLGRAARGCAAAGACALPSLCLQSWAGLPPLYGACMGLLMSSAFRFSLYILSIPMFDRRDHPSVPTMMGLGHGGGGGGRVGPTAPARGGGRGPCG